MNESILTSIKKLLGISDEYGPFDSEIITHINSVFLMLWQIGIGPYAGFSIKDDTTTWRDFLNDNSELEAVKSYMHLQVRKIFDPPSSSTIMDSNNRVSDELAWRLNMAAEDQEV